MALNSRVRTRARGANGLHYLGIQDNSYEYVCTEPYHETCTDELHGAPPYKQGGGLVLVRSALHRGFTADVNWLGAASRSYQGKFTSGWIPATLTSEGLPSKTPSSKATLDALGATGWARYKPGKAVANTGQFLAELHQLPTIPVLSAFKAIARTNFRKLGAYKKLGGEYLNVEFGWKPFLTDLRDMYNLTHTMDRRLAQLKRDNGKRIRRKGKVSNNTTVEVIQSEEITPFFPILTSEYYSSPGSRTVTVSTTDSSWFSAGFRYWSPDVGSLRWTNRAKRALWGINPSPSLLWEVLPWSWLIDWFSNTGDVLSNMSENAAENLAADYAFIMRTQQKTYEVMESQSFPQKPYSLECVTLLDYTLKERSVANPYGFGLTFDSLSDRQMLILAALGISRS